MSASQLLDVQISSTGAVALVPAPEGPALPEGYTAMTGITVGNVPYLCAYNATSGGTDLYAISETTPLLTLVDSRIDLSDGPWEKLTTFILGNVTYLLTYRAKDGMFGFYSLSADLTASPPYLFYFARNTPTVGFTDIAAISSLGQQYVLGYNFADGTVATFSVSVVNQSTGGVPPLNAINLWFHHWAKNWTKFAFFQMGGANFFFKINTGKLNVNIDHLNDNPALGTVEVGSWLQGLMPDALRVTHTAIVPWAGGDPYLMTYLGDSGLTTLLRIHANCQGWTTVATVTGTTEATLAVAFAVGDHPFILLYGGAA